MTKSKRTHPLDRDGDGEPGGSLPGNQTAPMATQDGDDMLEAVAETEPDLVEQARRDAPETDPMLAAAATADDQDDVTDPHADCVHCGESHPVGVLDEDLCPACVDEAPALDQIEANSSDTFDAEQVAAAAPAGEGAVMGEEGETVAEPAAATALADLVAVDDGERPVAVRRRELQILLTARRLYKSDQGYSASFGPPYIDQATVDVWLAAGLAEAVPSAGNQGGVRATAKARRAWIDAQEASQVAPQVPE